jgi:hypothetical protein
MTRKAYEAGAWKRPYSELFGAVGLEEEGLSLLTVKDISDARNDKTSWNYFDAQKAAGPDTALFRKGDKDVAYLALQNW